MAITGSRVHASQDGPGWEARARTPAGLQWGGPLAPPAPVGSSRGLVTGGGHADDSRHGAGAEALPPGAVRTAAGAGPGAGAHALAHMHMHMHTTHRDGDGYGSGPGSGPGPWSGVVGPCRAMPTRRRPQWPRTVGPRTLSRSAVCSLEGGAGTHARGATVREMMLSRFNSTRPPWMGLAGARVTFRTNGAGVLAQKPRLADANSIGSRNTFTGKNQRLSSLLWPAATQLT